MTPSDFVIVKFSLNDYNYDYDYFRIFFIRLRLRLRNRLCNQSGNRLYNQSGNRLYNRRDYTSLIKNKKRTKIIVFLYYIFFSDLIINFFSILKPH